MGSITESSFLDVVPWLLLLKSTEVYTVSLFFMNLAERQTITLV